MCFVERGAQEKDAGLGMSAQGASKQFPLYLISFCERAQDGNSFHVTHR